MTVIRYGAACGAAAVMMSVGVLAQSAGQQGPTSAPSPAQVQRPAPGTQSNAADQMVTVLGCVQREADYRKAQDAGRGGVAGTGIGVGNEYVLTNAMISSSASSSSSGSTSSSTAGSANSSSRSTTTAAGSGSGAQGVAANANMTFELTGPNEGQLAQHVGKRVEIMGKLKDGETTAAGRPTGGPTAGAPPSGVDVTSRDLRLREIEVSSVKAASGTCPN